jgi:hypothetical protein
VGWKKICAYKQEKILPCPFRGRGLSSVCKTVSLFIYLTLLFNLWTNWASVIKLWEPHSLFEVILWQIFWDPRTLSLGDNKNLSTKIFVNQTFANLIHMAKNCTPKYSSTLSNFGFSSTWTYVKRPHLDLKNSSTVHYPSLAAHRSY